MSDTLTEDEFVSYLARLRDLELAGERQYVAFGPYTAMAVIGALQLASRHPSMSDGQRAELAAVVDQFRPWFEDTPGEHLIDMGNDPDLDR